MASILRWLKKRRKKREKNPRCLKKISRVLLCVECLSFYAAQEKKLIEIIKNNNNRSEKVEDLMLLKKLDPSFTPCRMAFILRSVEEKMIIRIKKKVKRSKVLRCLKNKARVLPRVEWLSFYAA